MDPKPETYVVKKKGETLTVIAKQYGHSDWKVIWNHKLNDGLRRTRKAPEAIAIGDKIVIPPNPADVKKAQEKLEHIKAVVARLKKLRVDSERDFDKMEAELDTSYQKIKKFGDNVDLAAAIGTAFVAVAAEGASILKASTEATKEVAKRTALAGLAASFALEIAVNVWEPSWWAENWIKAWGGEDNETAYKNAKDTLTKTRNKTLGQLDIKIHDYEKALKEAGG